MKNKRTDKQHGNRFLLKKAVARFILRKFMCIVEMCIAGT